MSMGSPCHRRRAASSPARGPGRAAPCGAAPALCCAASPRMRPSSPGKGLSMAGGLAALLDDIAALARLAAASADDVAAASAKASSKAVGVVIDDAAVTPQYVRGIEPRRELPIIWRIAKGSLRNKLLIILPVLLLLSVI